MSKYIIDIDTIDNVTVTTLSDGIPLINAKALEWMNTSFLELSLNLKDGEYYAKLNSEPKEEEEPLYVLLIEVKNKKIIKVNHRDILNEDK